MFINLKLSLKRKNLIHISINVRKRNKGSHRQLGQPVVSPIFVNNYFSWPMLTSEKKKIKLLNKNKTTFQHFTSTIGTGKLCQKTLKFCDKGWETEWIRFQFSSLYWANWHRFQYQQWPHEQRVVCLCSDSNNWSYEKRLVVLCWH